MVAPPPPRKRRYAYDIDYHPNAAIELGKEGKSKAQIASHFEISKNTLHLWLNERPEFADAMDIAMAHAQAYWENLSEQGVRGEIKYFNAAALQARMKSQFRDDYTEVQRIEQTTAIVTLSNDDIMKRIASMVKRSPELLEVIKGNPLPIEGEVVHERSL